MRCFTTLQSFCASERANAAAFDVVSPRFLWLTTSLLTCLLSDGMSTFTGSFLGVSLFRTPYDVW